MRTLRDSSLVNRAACLTAARSVLQLKTTFLSWMVTLRPRMGALMPNASRQLSLSPTLCVCVLSHKRLDLLRTTLRSVVNHLEEHEPGLAYELVWVDNGSEQAEAHAMRAEFTFEKALLLGTNYGMAYGFNSLFFRLCSAPYFLTLEEDWEWIGDGQQPHGRLPAASR